MSADIALRNTVQTMVAAFEAAEPDVRAAFAQIVEAERSVNAAFGVGRDGFPDIRGASCRSSAGFTAGRKAKSQGR